MKKKKIEPWALGISIVLVAFPIIYVLIVVFFSGQHVNMVQDDYYEKGQAYQQEIDTRKRTTALEQVPLIVFDESSKLCVLLFQPAFAETVSDISERSDSGSDDTKNGFKNITGTVKFFRVSDSRHDFSKDLKLDANGRQVFKLSGLTKGPWLVKLHWKTGGLDYYIEERITIQG